MIAIGARIREDRKRAGLTLAQVAKEVGISIPYLSQIENGKVNLSIPKLESISRVLGESLVHYLVDPADQSTQIIRREDRHWMPLDRKARESVLIHSRGNIKIAVLHIEPGADTGQPHASEGEEFTYVSRGSLMIHLDKKIIELSRGDVIYYDSDIPHKWENPGDVTAEILVITSPIRY